MNKHFFIFSLFILFTVYVSANDEWIPTKTVDKLSKSTLLEEKSSSRFFNKVLNFGKKMLKKHLLGGNKSKSSKIPSIPNLPSSPKPTIRQKFTEASKYVTMDDANCVICQYLVQITQSELLSSMATGGTSISTDKTRTGGGGVAGPSFIEWTKDTKQQQADYFRFRQRNNPWTYHETKVMQIESTKSVGGVDKQFARADLLAWRPDEMRYAPAAPVIAQNRAQEEIFMNNAMSTVYYDIYGICVHRMPPFYKASCGKTLHQFRNVVQGLYYKDRPENICANIGVCNKKSYLNASPHQIRQPPRNQALL